GRAALAARAPAGASPAPRRRARHRHSLTSRALPRGARAIKPHDFRYRTLEEPREAALPLQRAHEGPFEVHDLEPGGPVGEGVAVRLARLLTRAQRAAARPRLELEPAPPRPVLPLLSPCDGAVRGPVAADDDRRMIVDSCLHRRSASMAGGRLWSLQFRTPEKASGPPRPRPEKGSSRLVDVTRAAISDAAPRAMWTRLSGMRAAAV